MYTDIDYRAIKLAEYIAENKCTIRSCAKHFNMAKSTVHFDLKNRLKHLDRELYYKVREILNENFIEKHLRGGEATRIKYLDKHENGLEL